MKKYQTKPQYVTAEQWDGTPAHLQALKAAHRITFDEVQYQEGKVKTWIIKSGPLKTDTRIQIDPKGHYFAKTDQGVSIIYTKDEFEKAFDRASQ